MKSLIIKLFLAIGLFPVAVVYGQKKSSYDVASEYCKEKNYKEAAVWFKKSIGEKKNLAQSFRYLGFCKTSLGDSVGGKSDVFYSLKLDPNNDSTFAEIGRVYLVCGDVDSSAFWAKKALAANPGCASYYDDMAIIRFVLYDYIDALSYENKAIALDTTKSVYFYNRGVVKEKLLRYDSAKADYEHAIKVEPSMKYRMDAYVNLANCEMLDQHFEKAIQIATRVLDYKPDVEQAIVVRGLSLVSLNRNEEGCKDFKKLATINPSAAKEYLEQYCGGK